MRVVLDTNILVRANPKVSPQGLARDLLLTVVSGPHVLVLSSAILVEVQRVLTYPHVQARWPLAQQPIQRERAAPDQVWRIFDGCGGTRSIMTIIVALLTDSKGG